ncbi:hypothetical protein [Rhizobium anhuiense]|uniref:Uncharacterized protein n=1 Tax=Rhizobium anhuiense TaxID=1184720 RepID=A0A432NG66_9HYPH|nr:hypothetical protein [Rhizobium anhuiense]RUL98551.1 hypothetical protein EEQ99_24060 [Rhizobium anhuiense]GGD97785.1 hypothetical protein GCM10008012_46840 [Rhizobium anhuiense]
MNHPIKRLRCKIETGEVRFEIEPMMHVDLLDYLGDLKEAFAEAYEQAVQFHDETPRGYRFAAGQLTEA